MLQYIVARGININIILPEDCCIIISCSTSARANLLASFIYYDHWYVRPSTMDIIYYDGVLAAQNLKACF